MVPGMFPVVETVNVHGLHDILATAVDAGLLNVLNNLPAYLAGEAAVPAANHDHLLALLIV